MTLEIIEKFIEDMSASGFTPHNKADIVADNKRRSFRIAGDPPKKKKGFYMLGVNPDGFGFGFFGDYRGDQYKKWTSGSVQKLTKAELRALEAQVAEQKRIAKEEKDAMHAEAATKAECDILLLDEAKEHPYLTRKNISGHGALADGQFLLIPMRNLETKEVCSYQKISPDGTKMYLKGGKKSGTFFSIRGDDTIALVEGFATGCTINEVMGWSVVVLWDAANLASSAEGVRKLYPYSEIVVCADNDHEKEQNAGIKNGKQALETIDGKMIFPPSEKGLSDFNDYCLKYGKEKTRDYIVQQLESKGLAIGGEGEVSLDSNLQPSPLKPWTDVLLRDSKNNVKARSTTNILLAMEHDPLLDGVFVFDDFAKKIVVAKCPPWDDENEFYVKELEDSVYIRLESYLEQDIGIYSTKNKCADAILSTAKLPKNKINPASDYFNSLEWDGVPRLKTWLQDYVSDGSQPKEYIEGVGVKFMCGMAKRAMFAGCKFDTMIIFEGKQNAGKSYLARIMGTVNGVEYFIDDLRDIENKDALMKMQGNLVVEFPEITTMRKAEVNELKAFLSRQEDVYREPYGRNTVTSKRQCVFVGTVNPEGGYLRDVTGNRRFLPISCRDAFPLDELKEVMPHLHAEASYLVKHGQDTQLSAKEFDLAQKEQEKRVMSDLWEDRILETVNGKTEISTADLLFSLGISTDKMSQIHAIRLAQAMTLLGWEGCRIREGGIRKRGYRKVKGQLL